MGFNNDGQAVASVEGNSSNRFLEYNQEVFNISNNIGHSEEPRIVKYGNIIYLVWIDDTSASRDIYFKKSTDNGCTFGPTINLGNDKGGSLDPQIGTSGNNVYMVWEHVPENNGSIFWIRSTDNGASFERVKNLGR